MNLLPTDTARKLDAAAADLKRIADTLETIALTLAAGLDPEQSARVQDAITQLWPQT